MGRSVSQHRDAVETVFIHLENEPDSDPQFEWECFIDGLKDILREKYPSLYECDRWAGREDHVILENRRCEISVSEYCGLVAVCLAPRDTDDAFSVGWCHHVAKSFDRFLSKVYKPSVVTPLGSFSNGETVYQRA